MNGAYYNENDREAAAWLRELIRGGHIAAGEVDDRDIRDVTPAELSGFTQCHFFAGIGGWSYALRLGGWPDERPVWTGSCPCQPFSTAGRLTGFTDERHLWPAWFHLITQRRPPVIFGEQVASPAGLGWFDLVSADLEASNHAVGAVDTCAAGLGAPHIRQRLYWVADNGGERWCEVGPHTQGGASGSGPQGLEQRPAHGGAVGLADATAGRWPGLGGSRQARTAQHCQTGGVADRSGPGLEIFGEQPTRSQRPPVERGGAAGGLGNSHRERFEQHPQRDRQTLAAVTPEASRGPDAGRPSAWADCAWLACRDGKSRPVEPGTFPLAHGVPGRVGLLRGYGNAIVPQVAAAFIQAYLTHLEELTC